MEFQGINQTIDHIRSTQVFPITKSQSQAVFVIEPQGILDKDSVVVLPMLTSQSTNPTADINGTEKSDAFLPVHIGIGATIKRATLTSLESGVVIAQNDDVANWWNIHNNFQSTEFRKRVLRPRWGISENYGPSDVGGVILDGTANSNIPGKISIDDLQYAYTTLGADNLFQTGQQRRFNVGGANDATNQSAVPDALELEKMRCYNITPQKSTTGQFYVRLNELFPKLYSVQLPTDLIKGKLQLVIQFNDESERVCPTQDYRGQRATNHGNDQQPPKAELILDEIVLLADFIVKKDNSEMRNQINSPEGLVMSYGELVWNKFYLEGAQVVGAGQVNTKKHTLKLGLSNQTVRQLYIVNNRTAGLYPNWDTQVANGNAVLPENMKNPLKLNWTAEAPSTHLKGNRIQLNINQRNLYPTDLSSMSRLQAECSNAYGAKFHKPFDTYSANSISVSKSDRASGAVAGNLFDADFWTKGMLANEAELNGWKIRNLYNTNHILGFNLQKPVMDEDGNLSRINIPGSGTLIGNTPIFIQYDCDYDQANRNLMCNVCACVERTILIKDGKITIVG